MFEYLLKRLVLIVPTIFMICLIVFVIVCSAPGQPGEALSADQASSQQGGTANSQKSFAAFKHQFALDKPILFNLRAFGSRAKVRRLLDSAVAAAKPTQRINAITEIGDWGEEAVPSLIEIASDPQVPTEQRHLALYMLPYTARRWKERVELTREQPEPTEAQLAQMEKNVEIEAENASFRRHEFKSVQVFTPEGWSGTRVSFEDELAGFWAPWYEEHRARYERSTGGRLLSVVTGSRFFRYLPRVLRFDFGDSVQTKSPVSKELWSRIKVTVWLNLVSILIAYLVAIPVGIYSAVKPHSILDRILTVVLFLLYSLPSFFVGVLLLVYLTRGSDIEWLRIFPTGNIRSQDGREYMTTLQLFGDWAWHAVLPVVTLTYASFAALSRYARTGLLEVIRADYVRTARAKGLSESTVILVHALRNGLIPVMTLLGGILPALFAGSIVVEYIFGIPGMGMLVIEAINARDFPVLIAINYISALLTLVGILLVDLGYVLLDPRISFGARV